MDYPSLDNVEAGFDGVFGFAAWGDSVTTLCLRQEPGRICAYGVAGSSGDDYLLWGAGFSLTLTPSLSEGRDLNALGIVGVQVELSGVAGRDVRLMATQANDPDLGEGPNYADNAFVFGGTSPRGFDSDVMLSLSLGDFTLPAWTQLVDESGNPREGQTLDLRNVSTLQFMVINNPNDSVANYSFCVNDFTFIDVSGEEVPLPDYVAPDAGVAEPEVDLPAEAGTDAGLAVTLDAG
jgi:hypothetical protein